MVKHVRQWGCVLQDTEPLESSSRLWKVTQVLGRIRRVRCTRATLRQDNIRDNKGPSLNKIQVKLLHQRSPYATKFEETSQGCVSAGLGFAVNSAPAGLPVGMAPLASITTGENWVVGVALQERRIQITVDRFLSAREKMLKNNANVPAHCLVTDVAMCTTGD